MKFYIDPGTGSMLFAILIGILGAARYVLKMAWIKLRFKLSAGKTEIETYKSPFVIFSDHKRYWPVFEPICREFDRRGIDVVYMTASPDDPVLECPYEHIKGQFIGEGNKAFAKLNFLSANIVLSTTPGLDVYQWKRSKEVQCYVHMLHAAGEVLLYRMFGIDYYDAILLSGEFQMKDVRKLEQMRGLPEKELCIVGMPYLDEMAVRLKESGTVAAHGRTVLLAPSWGPSAIFHRFGEKIIEELLKTGYHIIVRPHPQSLISEKELMDRLMAKYPDSDQLEWNRDNDNFEVLRRSDIMISDFSGVIFDFSLVYDKPVIYADTHFDRSIYDAWWVEDALWYEKTLPRIGEKLTEDRLGQLKDMIDQCLTEQKYEQGRETAREETWQFRGEAAVRTVDWLVKKYDQLTNAEEKK